MENTIERGVIFCNDDTLKFEDLCQGSAQQRGIGRLLVQTVIDHARRMGAKKISLVSSTRLVSALRLYASMGFVSKPLPKNPGYASADVYMERVL
ncbi:MAG: GNAT family N-acetyltransferase [Deltaproteobacteria bacterium]|nr:GNAT family N-acetyltransferase [Deltaproteobacteria bacterium]MBW2632521.1 GNAT family N-acetyltransferase [Deltaproteobacteria bacterium]